MHVQDQRRRTACGGCRFVRGWLSASPHIHPPPRHGLVLGRVSRPPADFGLGRVSLSGQRHRARSDLASSKRKPYRAMSGASAVATRSSSGALLPGAPAATHME